MEGRVPGVSMHILISLIIVALCSFCKFIGEIYWHNSQRFIMPLLIVFGISYNSGVWWLGIPSLLMIADIIEGYGQKSWLKKYLGDAGAQGMWMFMACVLAGLFSVCLGYVSLWLYIPWCILAGVLGATTRALNNKFWSWIKGAWIGLIVLFIHAR